MRNRRGYTPFDATSARVGQAAGVTSLVVVPRDSPGCRPDICRLRIHDGAARIALKSIETSPIGNPENALHAAVSGGAERLIDLPGGRGAANDRSQVHHRRWAGTRTRCRPSALLSSGMTRLMARGTRSRRDHVERGGTGAAQILVRQIQDALVIRA